MEKEFSSGIIIFRRTGEGPKFLLLYMGGGYWNFPKGKVENEEKTLEAAFREIEEETGLFRRNLRLIKGFRVYDNYTYARNRKKISKTVVLYLAETRRREIRVPVKAGPGEQHEGYAWLTYGEAIKMLSHENLRRNLRRAREFARRQQEDHHSGRPEQQAGNAPPVDDSTQKQNRPVGGSQKFGTDGRL